MPVFRRKFDPSLFSYSKGSGGQIVNPKLKGKGRYENRTSEGYTYTGTSPFRTKDGKTIAPGERISNRQYQNLRYQSAGWKSKAEYERISRQSATRAGRKRLTYKHNGRDVHEVGAFREWARIYSEEHNVSLRTALDPTGPYARAFTAAMDDDFSDLSPDGPFSQLLITVGLRDDQAQWSVGETP